MKKSIIFTVLLLLIAISGCTPAQNTEMADDGELVIVATFYPLYDLTKAIVGDSATVYSIIPSGVEPHDYEPNPSDFEKMYNADAFVTMGLEFEEFEHDLIEVNSNVAVIDSAKGIALLQIEEDDHHDDHDDDHHDEHDEEHDDDHHEEDDHHDDHDDDHHDEHDEEHDDDHHEEDDHHDDHDDDHHDEHDEEDDHHHHTGVDPHIWVSPKNAIMMVNNIVNGLVVADPENADLYVANANTLVEELSALDVAFSTSLSSCEKDTILVNHNAFSYLAHDYDLEVISIYGLEPHAEPTPKQIAELVEEAEEHDLEYIFYEELVDPRVAQTIASEVGAQVLELDPLEGTKDLSATYVSLMEQNLANLEVALACQ